LPHSAISNLERKSMTDEEKVWYDLTLEQVYSSISSDEKANLVKIGIFRFGMSVASANGMSKKDLQEKLTTMARNEETHDMIAKMAAKANAFRR
jgi:hypothetical protein